ncbi:MAG TPA: dihydropteroate synthase [Mycobacteriales bacterium]|nr:dihydropteroate synthase [Mycobacteriales bacterium]
MNAPVAGLPGLDRALVMGVVNVTPDSFSDGGRFDSTDAAVKRGLALVTDRADLLDIGGESSRPGAEPVTAEEEQRRVLPVITALAQAGVVISVDTVRASTAELALDAGAAIVNDISGGTFDPDLPRLVADRQVPYVVMHSRGPSATMLQRAVYDDVVEDVLRELGERMAAVMAAGVAEDRIVLDPGIGFAKDADQSWALLNALPRLRALGRPVLVGASRKTFLGRLLAAPDGTVRPVDERDDASLAVAAIAARDGAWAVRVHEAGPAADAVRVAARLRREDGS